MLAKGNLVAETTATVGQGTLSLAGALSDRHLTFEEAGIANGASVRYKIEEGDDVEVGTGVFSLGSPDTLSRVTVHASKIGGVAGTDKINISTGAIVRLVLAAEDMDAVEIAFDPSGLNNTDAADVQEAIEDHDAVLDEKVNISGGRLEDVFTAGESLVNGNLCYLASDGKFYKADADAAASATSLLAMCTATISADATGTFVVFGRYTTSGLTAGSIYYVSTTAGAITATRPSGSGDVVRVVGYALSTTVLYFFPSGAWVERP